METNNDKPLGLDDCAALLAAWIAVQNAVQNAVQGVHEKSILVIVKNRLIELHRERRMTMDVVVVPTLSREEVELFLYDHGTAVRAASNVNASGEFSSREMRMLVDMEKEFLKHFDPKPHYSLDPNAVGTAVMKNGQIMTPFEIVTTLNDLTERA